MASGAFSKAVKEATFSVSIGADGSRSIGRNAAMDREDNSNFSRSRSRGGRARG